MHDQGHQVRVGDDHPIYGQGRNPAQGALQVAVGQMQSPKVSSAIYVGAVGQTANLDCRGPQSR